MSLTAYLPPSLLSGLSDVSVSPGSAQDGYPLTWDNTLGKWVVSLLPISSLTGGPLPVSRGGTGSVDGSITGTGSLTFAAGGTNQAIALFPSGTGSVVTASPIRGKSIAINSPPSAYLSSSFPVAIQGTTTTCLQMIAPATIAGYPAFGVITTADTFNRVAFGLNNGVPFLGFGSGSADRDIFLLRSAAGSLTVSGNASGSGQGTILVTGSTESTSTTTGAIRTNGGLGIVKNVTIGGNLKVSGTVINFPNLPSSGTGLNSGDLWRDSNGFLKVV